MATKPWAILLVVLSTALTSIGQILYKSAAAELSLSIKGTIGNLFLIIGVIAYFLAALLLLISLKHGELSVLYPIVATGFIWVSLLSTVFFGETMNIIKWAGITMIIIGVSFIGFGTKEKATKEVLVGKSPLF